MDSSHSRLGKKCRGARAVTTDSAGILIYLAKELVTDNELQLSDGRPMLGL